MDKFEILKYVDHTLLAVDATESEIKQICDDAIKYSVASVCIPQSFIPFAKEYLKGRIKICTVIGFPNGYSSTAVKCFEAEDAINNGADEIDMVINVGWVKDKKFNEILDEIKKIKSVCGDKILKVIIETCLLTDDEKIKMCKVVSESGADFIKTSTGFSTSGATKEDVALFKSHIFSNLKIKAAGGISSFKDAEDFINLGASRLGTSRLIKIIKNEESTGY